MTHQECFEHISAQPLSSCRTFNTPSGLSIHPKGTSWAGFHEAFRGAEGTELVIGEYSEVEISFNTEVELLHVDFYVISDQFCADWVHTEFDELDYPLLITPPRNFYWLTLSGSGFTEHLPGPLTSQPQTQVLIGPFRRLTISTSQAGTVHIRRLAWTRTCRH